MENSRPKKIFSVNNLDSLQKEFFRSFDMSYWSSKISLLKNSHDSFSEIKPILRNGLEENEIADEEYKRTLRTELHFLYFQMVECLFEMIFAVASHDNRNLWIALTFSNDKRTVFHSDCYKRIDEFATARSSNEFRDRIKYDGENGALVDIPLLQWVFYFTFPTKLSPEQMTKNLKNIESLLKTFAKDFSDKKEYNAYKHGLRCFNAKSQISMGLTGTQQMHVIGQSEDAIYYLEEHVPDSPPQNPDEPVKINRVTKSFDFERDYRCCVLIDELIKCIINTRKYSIVDELRGKQCSYATFDTIEFPAVVTSKAGIHRFSMTA